MSRKRPVSVLALLQTDVTMEALSASSYSNSKWTAFTVLRKFTGDSENRNRKKLPLVRYPKITTVFLGSHLQFKINSLPSQDQRVHVISGTADWFKFHVHLLWPKICLLVITGRTSLGKRRTSSGNWKEPISRRFQGPVYPEHAFKEGYGGRTPERQIS